MRKEHDKDGCKRIQRSKEAKREGSEVFRGTPSKAGQ